MTTFPAQKLYQVAQIRAMEQQAFAHTPEVQLMECAGQAAFQALKAHYPNINAITVVCGAGNNGGDGLVVARLAAQAGMNVKVLTVGDFQKQTDIAKEMLRLLMLEHVLIQPFEANDTFSGCELIIDALLGIGIKGIVKAPFDEAITAINASLLPVFSLDLPSGLNADTGQPCGCCVISERTMTFIGLKQGMVTGKARQYCGVIECDNLGLVEALKQQTHFANLIGKEALPYLSPKPPAFAHKGSQGHVVVVGGDEGMPGAVCLAAEAALRVGAGKVTIVTRAAHFSIVMSRRSEFICKTVENDFSVLDDILATANVCVIGPGMMSSEWSRQALKHCLAFLGPKVLDAGALALLSDAPCPILNAIVTPHPGEAASLLKTKASEIEANRYRAVENIAKRYAQVVVLKGAGSLIYSQENGTDVCALGNAGMASAGMGDVLAGVIGGLVYQFHNLHEAARAGVLLHSHAGDLAANAQGRLNILAGDLFSYFRWESQVC